MTDTKQSEPRVGEGWLYKWQELALPLREDWNAGAGGLGLAWEDEKGVEDSLLLVVDRTGSAVEELEGENDSLPDGTPYMSMFTMLTVEQARQMHDFIGRHLAEIDAAAARTP